MKFDAQRAYHHISQLAHPRAVGSIGESRARAYIVAQLAALGLNVKREHFDFTLFPADILPRLISAVYTVGIIVVCWITSRQPLYASVLCIGMLLIALSLTRWQKRLEWLYGVGKAYHSENIVATSCPPTEEAADLIFVAHYDSKSQLLPIGIRALCYCTAIGGLIGLTLLTLIQLILKMQAPASLIWAIAVPICSCLILLQFNFTQNRSPGAFDNASGVGVLLELARGLTENPLIHPARLTFLLPGAEEYGMCGALRYIQQHTTDYNPERTYVINLDGVGAVGRLTLLTSYGIPPVVTSKGLASAIVACGKEIGVAVSKFYSPAGVGCDQLPIASRGFETVTLSSGGFGKAAFQIHSKRDEIDLIHLDTLKQVGEMLGRFVRHTDFEAFADYHGNH